MKRWQYINGLGILYLFVVGWAWLFSSISFLVVLLGPIMWIGLLAWGSFDIRLNLFVTAFSSSKTIKDKRIALTFDDGPTPFTMHVLDLLKQYNAKATFFCIGKQVEQYPHILKRILSEGHSIGNHTQTHTQKMGFLSTKEVLNEILLAEQTIETQAGFKPNLFRPPFGVTNPNIAKAIKQTDYSVIGWNIRSLDTVIEKEDRIFERVKNKIKPGSIILFHDTSKKSVTALESVLKHLQHQEYALVAIEELLNLKRNEKAS